jgi:hypothetical protein
MATKETLTCAPVALFVYNRLWHTQRTVEALVLNKLADQTDLYVFSDGPRSAAERSKVTDVRNFVKTITGFKSVRLIESDGNRGLANSVINGVTKVLESHDRIIVLEDDMITSPGFLEYMNTSLGLYEHDDRVISIHGYVYPVKRPLPPTFFLKGADCWGWATWKRGWALFEPDEFDFNNSYPYTRMLKNQIAGRNDSWAIRWYASAFLRQKLTLYPGISLVKNIGNDSSGTHSWDNERYDHDELAQSIKVEKLTPEENLSAKEMISDYLRATTPSLLRKTVQKIKSLIR